MYIVGISTVGWSTSKPKLVWENKIYQSSCSIVCLSLLWIKRTAITFFFELQPFFLWFCGVGLAFTNKMNCQEGFVFFCLLCVACHNLDPKIHFDGVSCHDKRVHGQYESKIKSKSYGRNWNIRVWAVYSKLDMTWNSLKIQHHQEWPEDKIDAG